MTFARKFDTETLIRTLVLRPRYSHSRFRSQAT